MTTPNPENYEDIAISEKTEENRCIEQLGYDRFIRLCIQSTREAVLHRDTQTPAAADLQHALDFLDGKNTASALGRVDIQLLKQILRHKTADTRRKCEPMPPIGEYFQRGRCRFMA